MAFKLTRWSRWQTTLGPIEPALLWHRRIPNFHWAQCNYLRVSLRFKIRILWTTLCPKIKIQEISRLHSSGLVQIRVWNLTPKNKVKTSPILMRGLNVKSHLNYLLQRLISPFWRICQEILPEVFYDLFLAWHKQQKSVKSKTSEVNSSSCHGPCSHVPHLF
jgi:hypothetical protein